MIHSQRPQFKPGWILHRLPFAFALTLLLVQPWTVSRAQLAGQAILRPAMSQAASAGRLPMSFVPNAGQSDPAVLYQAHALGGEGIFFTKSGVKLVLPSEAPTSGKPLIARELSLADDAPVAQAAEQVLQVSFIGANPAPQMVGENRLPGIVSYFIGSDSSQWHTNLPTFGRVVYKDLYPGIDLSYEGSASRGPLLKGTYSVAPGADPSRIRWRYQNASGLSLDATGSLHIPLSKIGAGRQDLLELAPVAWQENNGQRIPVATQYSLAADGSIGFAMPKGYDPSQPLVLDPALTYASFLGGNGEDVGYNVAVDSTGIYVVGYTFSTNFPTDGPIDPDCGTDGFCNSSFADVFITKLNPAGNDTLYSTYLGGSGNDYGVSVALDSSNNAYITGLARADFPTTPNAYQRTYGAGVGADAFLVKLNSTGSSLLYSTYLGSDHGDGAWGLVVDASNGDAFLNGQTFSTGFPTIAGAYDSTCGTDGTCNFDGSTGHSDSFVVQLSTTISGTASLLYSTYLGGSSDDQGYGVARDSSGQLYVTGRTLSTDMPTPGTPYQGSNGGYYDAYVAKLDLTQSGTDGLIYGTYLGGLDYDDGYTIAVDDSNEAYLIGTTASTGFPMENPIQGTFGGGPYDAYVAKLESAGSALSYSTFLGGSGDDEGYGLAIDASHNVNVTGFTSSTDFPTQNAFQPLNMGGYEAFVTQINSAGSVLAFSTYLGGPNTDAGYGIFYTPATSSLYLAGQTYSSTGFPLVNPYQANNAGGSDVLVSRIDQTSAFADLSIIETDAIDPVQAGTYQTYTMTITNSGPDTATGVRFFDNLQGQLVFSSATTSQGSGCVTGPLLAEVSCDLGNVASGNSASVTLFVIVYYRVSGFITNNSTAMSNLSDPNGPNNSASQDTTVLPSYGVTLPLILR